MPLDSRDVNDPLKVVKLLFSISMSVVVSLLVLMLSAAVVEGICLQCAKDVVISNLLPG